MTTHRYAYLLASLLIFAGTSFAQPAASQPDASPTGEGLSVLRGFRIGLPCSALGDAYSSLRKEGFKLPSLHSACNVNAGEFRTDYLLHENDDRQELIELHYTPESVLWRSKVTWTWQGAARLSLRPTHEQVIASLNMRFGKPVVFTSDGALLDGQARGAHAVAMAWSATPVAAGMVETPSDSMTWTRWTKALTGVVTRANVRWSDLSPRVDLVVEMADESVLPRAIKAQEDARAAKDAAWARQDARMLRGL